MSETRNYILDEVTAYKKMLRMAYEIAEQNLEDCQELILAGIRENGVLMAHIIAGHLKDIFPGTIHVIEIALNKRHPAEITLSEQTNFDDAVIILVDDVTNSGKTLLYALQPFLQFHPRKIQALTLVERTHKLFPISSDYVGLMLATTLQEHIFVEVVEERIVGAYLV